MNIPVVHTYIDMLQGMKNNLILAPTGNLGISRSEMPQIDGNHRAEFIKFLRDKGLVVRDIRIPAASLKMVQGEYNRDKVGSIMSKGNIGGDPIFVSKDGYIVDGNHRLIAHINLPSAGPYIEVTEIGLDIRSLLLLIRGFSKVRYRGINESKG